MTSDPSDPTPERPGMGADPARRDPDKADRAEQTGATQGGQVSEASGLDPSGAPISDGDSVGGYPESESGGPDEGPQGPIGNPHPGARNT